MFRNAERVLSRAQQRVVIVRRVVGDAARAMIGDDNGWNLSPTAVRRVAGLESAAALCCRITVAMRAVIFIPSNHDGHIVLTSPYRRILYHADKSVGDSIAFRDELGTV